MGILQGPLAFIIIAGFVRIFLGIRNFFVAHPRLHLANNANKYAFVITGLLAAVISVPILTLGLPGIFRTITFLVYIGVAGIGLWWGYELVTSAFNRLRGGNGGNGTNNTK